MVSYITEDTLQADLHACSKKSYIGILEENMEITRMGLYDGKENGNCRTGLRVWGIVPPLSRQNMG